MGTWTLLLWLTAWAAAPAKVDALALAGVLMADGHADRAETALALATAEDDPARFHTLWGLVHQALGRPAEAAASFRAAIATGEAEPIVHLSLAEALSKAGDVDGALEALEAAPAELEALPARWLLEARLRRAQGDDDAWRALGRGASLAPEDLRFPVEQVQILSARGLTREAVALTLDLVGRTDARTLAGLASTLRADGHAPAALTVLEAALLAHPDDRDLLVALASSHLALGRPAAAGDLLARAVERDPSLAAQAAECHRQAGDLDRALQLNALVADGPEKVRQRLGLLLEKGDLSRALALEDRLVRLGLTEEDEVRYALAYASFRTGDRARSEAWIQRIDDPEVFRRATALREAMTACEAEPWTCE